MEKCSAAEMYKYIETNGLHYEQGGVRHSVLCAALRNPSDAVVECVLARNVDLKNVCASCLPVCCAAARRFDGTALRRLIAAGADPNERDKCGASALHYAVLWTAEMCHILLRAGVDINIASTGDGSRPLHWAVEEGSNLVIEYLLARGADPKAPDHDGDTPLSQAPDSHWLGCTPPRTLLLEAIERRRRLSSGGRKV